MAAPDVIRLSDQDNVAVAVRDIATGARIRLGALELTALDPIPLGHKVALRDMPVGDTVMKYGVDIGKVVQPIKKGAHAHVHNIKNKRW